MHPTAKTLRIIAEEINAIYLERVSSVEAQLCAILAAEHFFSLGVPGTAKSESSREILSRIVGDPAWTGPAGEPGTMLFDTQLTRFTPADKVFGTIDVPALRDHGDYHHKINGFAATARFAHIDEIGKANGALLGSMLTWANERKFHNNAIVMDCPLAHISACSNEELVAMDEENAAIWDRMLVRVKVDPIRDPANFTRMLQAGASSHKASRTTIDYADLAEAIDTLVPAIPVPQNIFEALVKLRDDLRKLGLQASDRRFRKSIRLMQASAFLNGRSQVEEDDLAVCRFVFWDTAEDIPKVERAVLTLSNEGAGAALAFLDIIEAEAAKVNDLKAASQEEKRAFGTPANGRLKKATNELDKLRQDALAKGRSTTKIDEVLERAGAVKRLIYVECLGMEPAFIR